MTDEEFEAEITSIEKELTRIEKEREKQSESIAKHRIEVDVLAAQTQECLELLESAVRIMEKHGLATNKT